MATATKATHTPGPWAFAMDHPNDKTIAYIRIAGTEGWGNFDKEIAVLYPNLPATEANARLIAAAPEMLEALETLLRLNDDPTEFEGEPLEAIAAARDAVRKARGEQ